MTPSKPKHFTWINGRDRRHQRNIYHAHKMEIQSEKDVVDAIKQLKEEVGGSTYSVYAYILEDGKEGYCDSGERCCGPALLNMLRKSNIKGVIVSVFAIWHGKDNSKLQRIQLICEEARNLVIKGDI